MSNESTVGKYVECGHHGIAQAKLRLEVEIAVLKAMIKELEKEINDL